MMNLERKRLVLDDQVARLQLHVVVGAKSEVVVLALRRCIDPSALVATEWTFLVVAGDDVLAELRPESFEPVSEVPEDRKGPEDCVLTLRQIVDRNRDQQNDPDNRDPDHEDGAAYRTSAVESNNNVGCQAQGP